MTDLDDALRPMFDRHRAPAEGEWDGALWATLAEGGFTAVGVPEDRGGSGGDLTDAAAVTRLAAEYAAAVPIGETLLLGRWLETALGLPPADGPTAVAAMAGTSGRDHGDAADRARTEPAEAGALRTEPVPYLDVSARLIVVTRDSAFVLDPAPLTTHPDRNLAGEPRARVELTAEHADPRHPLLDGVRAELHLRRGLLRALTIAGALRRVTDLTVRYAGERHQFGRPIGAFQAVRQQVSLLAAEEAVTASAVRAAVARVAEGAPDRHVAVCAARVRAAQAATDAARLAHQVHGAMGVTAEYELHRFTRRLWAGRDEYGTQAEWEEELGRAVLAAPRFWEAVVPLRR